MIHNVGVEYIQPAYKTKHKLLTIERARSAVCRLRYLPYAKELRFPTENFGNDRDTQMKFSQLTPIRPTSQFLCDSVPRWQRQIPITRIYKKTEPFRARQETSRRFITR